MTAGLASVEPNSSAAPLRQSPARRSPWIISPVWDLALLVGSPLAIVPTLLWLSDHWASPESIAAAVLAFASAGHHLPGFLRAYGERDLFRRFRWRFLLAPPIAIAVSLAFALRDLHGLSLVMLFWATWHGLMQTYGFMRIYDVKRGSRDALTARLDWALCLAIFATGVLFSDARVANLAETFWLSGGGAFDASLVQALRIAGGAGLAIVVAACLVNVVRQGRSLAGASGVKLALAASTGWLYWLGGALSTNVLIGVAMFEVFHALQYYAIVWVYNCRLAQRLGERGGWARFLFQRKTTFLALYLGAIAAWGLPYFLGADVLSERALAIVLAVYTASAMLHFYYDGFIWKVRESDVQANLGVEPAKSTPAPPRFSGASLHWAKCLTLAALLGLLAYGEMRSSATRANENTIVSRLEAIAGDVPEVQVRASRVAMERGDAPAALEHARKAVANRPRSEEAQYQLGWALLASGRPKEAASALETACRLAPNQWRNHFRLALARVANEEWEGAEESLLRARELAPNAPEPAQALGEFQLKMGELHRQQDEFSLAAERFEKAAAISPKSFAAWNNLGAMRYELGEMTGAVAAWRRAVEIEPENGAAHYNLGLALLEQEQFGPADEEFERAENLGFRRNRFMPLGDVDSSGINQ